MCQLELVDELEPVQPNMWIWYQRKRADMLEWFAWGSRMLWTGYGTRRMQPGGNFNRLILFHIKAIFLFCLSVDNLRIANLRHNLCLFRSQKKNYSHFSLKYYGLLSTNKYFRPSFDEACQKYYVLYTKSWVRFCTGVKTCTYCFVDGAEF